MKEVGLKGLGLKGVGLGKVELKEVGLKEVGRETFVGRKEVGRETFVGLEERQREIPTLVKMMASSRALRKELELKEGRGFWEQLEHTKQVHHYHQ
jgi:hypothetical protein